MQRLLLHSKHHLLLLVHSMKGLTNSKCRENKSCCWRAYPKPIRDPEIYNQSLDKRSNIFLCCAHGHNSPGFLCTLDPSDALANNMQTRVSLDVLISFAGISSQENVLSIQHGSPETLEQATGGLLEGFVHQSLLCLAVVSMLCGIHINACCVCCSLYLTSIQPKVLKTSFIQGVLQCLS